MDAMLWKLLLLCGAVAGALANISCYDCVYATASDVENSDAGCKDPDTSHVQIDCSFCLEHRVATDEVDMITRMCVPTATFPAATICDDMFSGFGDVGECMTCETDLCNGALFSGNGARSGHVTTGLVAVMSFMAVGILSTQL